MMLRVAAALFILVFMTGSPVQSQSVQLTQFPAPLQLYPRGTDNHAAIPISGILNIPGFDSVVVNVERDGDWFQHVAVPLVYNDNVATFSLEARIKAELSEYKLSLYAVSSNSSLLLASRDSIVCGDVYIINGQSNSWPSRGDAKYVNEFCRGFGRSTGYDPYNPADTTWALSHGNGWSGKLAHAGAWGIRLEQYIVETYGIPVALLNGGSGGSSIEYNLPGENTEDLETTYGRLLYRARKAGVADNVRAIFWHQGESNSRSTWVNYESNFQKLYTQWKNDFGGLEHIYVFQIHPGCGGEFQSELRDIQRRFPLNYDDIEVMSTVGLPGHDGCHYKTEGYYEMALWLFRQLARDFYGSSDTIDIDPPTIRQAFYSTPQHDELRLVFDRATEVIWPDDTLGYKMEQAFFVNDSAVSIIAGECIGDTVILHLSDYSTALTVSYLPGRYYPDTNRIYQGPWIKNPRGIGALSFHQFPISFPPMGAPELIEPKNEAIIDAAFIELRWKGLQDAEEYQIEVASDPQFLSIIDEQLSYPDTVYTFINLVANSTYYWRAKAANDDGAGRWSEEWSFTSTSATEIGTTSSTPSQIAVGALYPNPVISGKNAAGFVTLPYEIDKAGIVKVKIVDLLGRECGTAQNNYQLAGKHQISIQISGLRPGHYQVIVSFSGAIVTQGLRVLK
jgi:Carbohydrate esterase, sialic acid-specific acetylesterase